MSTNALKGVYKEFQMKRFLSLVAASAVVFAVGCASTSSNSAAPGAVGACEKGEKCCKVTGNKTDCKASCSEGKSCTEGKTCTDGAKKEGAMGAVGTEKKSCSGGTCPMSGSKN